MKALEEHENLLIFRVGPISCCVSVRDVDSIVVPHRLRSIPGQASFIAGVFHYRDKTVAVVSLFKKFGIGIQDDFDTKGRFVVAYTRHGLTAFMVDEVLEVTSDRDYQWSDAPALNNDNVFDRTLNWHDKFVLATDFDRLYAMKESAPLKVWAEQQEQVTAAPTNELPVATDENALDLSVIPEPITTDGDNRNAGNDALVTAEIEVPASEPVSSHTVDSENNAVQMIESEQEITEKISSDVNTVTSSEKSNIFEIAKSKFEGQISPLKSSTVLREEQSVSVAKNDLKSSTDSVVDLTSRLKHLHRQAEKTATPPIVEQRDEREQTAVVGNDTAAAEQSIHNLPDEEAEQSRFGEYSANTSQGEDNQPAFGAMDTVVTETNDASSVSVQSGVPQESTEPHRFNKTRLISGMFAAATMSIGAYYLSTLYNGDRNTATDAENVRSVNQAESAVATLLAEETPTDESVANVLDAEPAADETKNENTGIDETASNAQNDTSEGEGDEPAIVNELREKLKDENPELLSKLPSLASTSPTVLESTSAQNTAEIEHGDAGTVDILPGWSSHTITLGDTLWDLSNTYLGNPYRYPQLATWSHIRNPDRIYPGNRVIYKLEKKGKDAEK